jgi:hypothetical protein
MTIPNTGNGIIILMAEQTSPAPQTNVTIKQINLAYHQDQDRLLLRVGLDNDTELVLWLTYRIARAMWAQLNETAHLPMANLNAKVETPQLAVEQFHQEVKAADTLRKLDFVTEYQPPKEKFNQTEMLATAVSLIDNENASKSLEISCLDGVNIRLNLNHEITVAICNMLQLASKEADWHLGGARSASATLLIPDSKTKQVLH